MFSALARKSVLTKSTTTVVGAAVSRSSGRNAAAAAASIRSFSDRPPNDIEDLHQPPVDLYGIEARYANATYTAASKKHCLDVVESELNGLAQAAEDSKQFSDFLQNPLIGREEKASTIGTLLKEKNMSEIVINLCTTLAENARMEELPAVAATYGKLMKAKRGEIDATIISAEPLSKKETTDIQAAIKGMSKGASNVIISSKIDPSIIGGIQVQIGDQFLDLSVKSRIDEISRMSI